MVGTRGGAAIHGTQPYCIGVRPRPTWRAFGQFAQWPGGGRHRSGVADELDRILAPVPETRNLGSYVAPAGVCHARSGLPIESAPRGTQAGRCRDR